jgi:septin family protein
MVHQSNAIIFPGGALTCWALYGASRAMRTGDHNTTNKMFRARIYAQGFTLLCLVAGSYYYAEDREKRKVFTNKKAEQKAIEKREKWIKELEARDQEAREEREARMKKLERKLEKLEKEESKLPVGIAKSVLERSEERWKLGVLEAVQGRRNPWRSTKYT